MGACGLEQFSQNFLTRGRGARNPRACGHRYPCAQAYRHFRCARRDFLPGFYAELRPRFAQARRLRSRHTRAMRARYSARACACEPPPPYPPPSEMPAPSVLEGKQILPQAQGGIPHRVPYDFTPRLSAASRGQTYPPPGCQPRSPACICGNTATHTPPQSPGTAA